MSSKRVDNRIGARPLVFAMDPAESLDVDTELDWQIVEATLRVGGGPTRLNLNDPLASAERWFVALSSCGGESNRGAGLVARTSTRACARSARSVRAGDRTLEIDALAEDAVFDGLGRLAAEGASFTAVSEERGTVVYGDGPICAS